jgi:hypothetical protein
MYQNYDAFDAPEMPYIILTNPSKQEMYALSGIIYNTKITKRFNGLSEFEFTIPSTTDNGDTFIEAYDYVQAKRLVLVEGEGYFIIDNVDENTDGQNHIKVVKSKSLEAEMLNKRFNSYKGTFKFYNFITVSGQTTLMDTVIALLPTWSVGYVDLAIAAKYRTFDVNDTTVYGFLINDCEKAFECIFVFDTVAKTINVYSTTSAVTATDIYLSYDNLIKNSTMSEITDEIATSLYCTGGGTLGINLVNPLGTNKIYDFTYYKNINWMSQDLVDAITAWEALIASNQAAYAAILTDYRIKNLELITLQNELVELNTQYTVKETEQKVRIQAGQNISGVNAMLLAIKGWIVAKEAEITAKQAELTALLNSATAINTALSFDTNFTPTQFDELSEFIYENSYQNSNLIVTDLSTPVDYQDTSQELYDQSISVLSRSSLPRYEFKMDTANFVAMKEYSAFTGELALGCTVTVNVNDRYTVIPVLLEISMSYDDPTQFSLTFSNRLRLDNGNFQYADLMGQVVSTGSAVAGNADQWSNWDNNYKDTVSTFITSALDASRNMVVNSTNQEILINTNGLRGRTLTSPGVYDPHQVWLTSNILAFTDDNWDTAKLALGQIEWNGNTVYGLVADVVVGRLLAGNQLTITNEGSNFTLDQSGARLRNASFVIENNNMAIVMTPNEETINGITSHGISIQSKATGIWENVFYTDADGNLIIKGTFSVSNGDLGGWHINSTGLYDDLGNYIYSNGNVHLGGMTLTPGSARFTGDVYASRLFGRVVGAPNYQFGSITDAYIGSLNANKITAGTMIADRIYGGTMRGPNGIELSISGTGFPYLKGDAGVGLWAGSTQFGGIEVRPGAAYIGGVKTYMLGETEFQGPIGVAGKGLGQTLEILAGTAILSFANGILVQAFGGAGAFILSWSKRIIYGTDLVPSAYATLACTLAPNTSASKTFIVLSLSYSGDADSNISLYALNGTTRVATATIRARVAGSSLTYAYFESSSTPITVTGFELALTAGAGADSFSVGELVTSGYLPASNYMGIQLSGLIPGMPYLVVTNGSWSDSYYPTNTNLDVTTDPYGSGPLPSGPGGEIPSTSHVNIPDPINGTSYSVANSIPSAPSNGIVWIQCPSLNGSGTIGGFMYYLHKSGIGRSVIIGASSIYNATSPIGGTH